MFEHISLLVCLVISTLAVHDTRFLGDTTYLTLMVGEYQDLSLPITLEKYQSVDFKAAPLQMDICQLEDFDIQIKEKEFSNIGVYNTHIDVITSYDFLLSQIHLIDMILFEKSLYFAYSDGMRRIDYSDRLQKFLPLPQLQRPLSNARFIRNLTGYNLYLADNNGLTRVNGSSFSPITGYKKLKELVSGCFLDPQTMAIIDREEGLKLYGIQEDEIVFERTYDKTFFGEDIEFEDVVLGGERTLFILDRKRGVIKFTLHTESNMKSEHTLLFNLTRDCSKMKIDRKSLYVICTQLHHFNLTSLAHKQYDHPSFRIKDILILDSNPLVVGNNIIKLYNGEYQIDSHVNSRIIRIINVGNHFVVGNNRGVKTVEWKIVEPTITCGIKKGTPNPPSSGYILVDIVAKCNQTFFQQQGKSFEDVHDELCLYHFPIEFVFWVGKQINLSPLKIILMALGWLSLALCLVWIFYKVKVRRLRKLLSTYEVVESSTMTDISNTKKYEQFHEQNLEQKESEGTGNQKNIDNELHDIGD